MPASLRALVYLFALTVAACGSGGGGGAVVNPALQPAPGFGTDGYVQYDPTPSTDLFADVTVMDDGRILAVGTAGWVYDPGQVLVTRTLPTGAPDPTFGTGGSRIFVSGGGAHGEAVDVHPVSGRIVVAAQYNGDVLLIALEPDGAADGTFGFLGFTIINIGGFDVPKAVRILDNGRIVVAGSSDGAFFVARVLATGMLDSSFGGASTGMHVFDPSGQGSYIPDAEILANGSTILIGSGSVQGQSQWRIVRTTASGLLDAGFGAGGYAHLIASDQQGSSPEAVEVRPGGEVIVAGDADGNLRVVQLTSAGQLDTAFGVRTLDLPEDLSGPNDAVLLPDGRLQIFDNGGGLRLWRLLPSGANDTSFGSGGLAYVGTDATYFIYAAAWHPTTGFVGAGSGKVIRLIDG